MPRPEIGLLDPELYPWYVDFERNRDVLKIGHTLMSAVQPRMQFGEGVREEIQEHYLDSGMFMFVASHQSIFDQFYAADMTREDPETLGFLEGETRIPVKAGLMKRSKLRTGIEHMGGFPITRTKDMERALGRDLTEFEKALLKVSHKEAIKAQIDMLEGGQHIFSFPQSTRDPDMTRMDKGPGWVSTGVSDDINLAIVPVGIYYPRFRGIGTLNLLRATMYFDHPIKGPFTEADEVNAKVFDRICKSVGFAKQATPKIIYKKPKYSPAER